MRSILSRQLGSLVLGLPLACGAAKTGLDQPGSNPDGFFGPNGTTASLKAAQSFLAFPGGGSSGAAQPLSASLAPDTSDDCDPQPSASASGSGAPVQTVCFFSADNADVPAATIEQVVEVVGTTEWVHMRLTLNPDFVDNTYGDTAIGWGDDGGGAGAQAPGQPKPPRADEPTPPADGPPPPSADAPPPPADGPPPPPAADAPPPPADGPPPPPAADAPPAKADAPPAPGANGPRPPKADAPPAPGTAAPPAGPGADAAPGAGRPRPGKKGGHTFRDLVGSDHAEIELLNTSGDVSVHFKLDYVSESATAPSGYASLGVSGGEGKLIVGKPEWILASATSIDRNLNACGLGSFLESSPATDAAYTPNPSASDWDYRVAYEVWVSTEAFGSAGFGSALIDNVHASPSKGSGDTANVLPAPCPVDPANPDAVPQPLPVVLQPIR